jgi:thiol-disulfide isomerase/thioredoxin
MPDRQRSSCPYPGKTIPHFRGRRVDGGAPFRDTDLTKPAAVVVFWATWRSACREDLPRLLRVAAKFDADYRDVVAVALDEDEQKVAAFIASEVGESDAWTVYLPRAEREPVLDDFVIVSRRTRPSSMAVMASRENAGRSR